jgi:WD40 repeat protein
MRAFRLHFQGDTNPDSPPTLPATSPPGYVIERELGAGGMGVVYLARQEGLDRPVALKMIRSGTLAGAEEVARFVTEAQVLARLRHPHIVQVFEIGQHQGQPFFSLEYCPGGSLKDRLAGTPLPAVEATRLVLELAQAVAHAHAQGILHRDLKPANVLLDETGSPRIADFGLAQRLDADSTLTHTGAVMGTPAFMAPEQARGEKVGTSADLYALGAILYACLTGRPPFQGATVQETLEQVRTREPAPPRQLNPSVPRDLETICLKCLHKEPARRYRSTQELADDLGRFRNGEPIQARPVSSLERAWLWTRRNPVLAGMTSLAALALVAALGIAIAFAIVKSWDATRLQEALGTSEERRQKVQRFTRLSSVLAFDRGQRATAQGCVREGTLWFARAIEIGEEVAPDVQFAARCQVEEALNRLPRLDHLFEHDKPVGLFDLLPGDRIMAWLQSEPATFDCWEAATGKFLWRYTLPPRCAVWAREARGSLLALLVSDPMRQYRIVLIDLTTGETRPEVPVPVAPLRGGKARLPALAMTPDARFLLVAASDGAIHTFDIAAGRWQERKLGRMEGLYGGLVVSPDGRFVAAYSDKQGLTVWDLESGTNWGPPLRVTDGQFVWSPDSDSIIVREQKLTRRAARAAQVLASLETSMPITRLDRMEVLPGTDLLWLNPPAGGIGLVDVRTLQPKPPAFTWPTNSIIIDMLTDPAGRLFAGVHRPTGRHSPYWTLNLEQLVATNSLVPRVVDLEGAEVLTRQTTVTDTRTYWSIRDRALARWALPPVADRLPVLGGGSHERLYGFTLSRDGQRIATAEENRIRIWDTTTAQPTGADLPTPQPSRVLAFSPDGQLLIVPRIGGLTVWDLRTRQPRWTTLQPADSVLSSVLDRTGKHLWISTPQGIEKRDLATGEVLATFFADRGFLRHFAPDPEGKRLLVLFQGGGELIDLETGQPAGTLRWATPGNGVVAWGPDGSCVVSGRPDVHLLTAAGTDERWRVEGVMGNASVSPDGEAVALVLRTTGQRDRLEVRSVPGGRVLLRVDLPPSPGQVTWSRDGQTIAWSQSDSILAWDVASGSAIKSRPDAWARLLAARGEPSPLVTDNLPGVWEIHEFLHDYRSGLPLGSKLPGQTWPATLPDSRFPLAQRDRLWVASGAGANVYSVAIPHPVGGTPAEVRRRVEAHLGLELTDDGDIRQLSPAEWRQRLPGP